MTALDPIIDVPLYEELIASDSDGFARALARAGIGMWYLDADEDVVHYNELLLEFFGISGDERISRDEGLFRFIHPDDVARTRATSEAHLPVGRPFEIHHRFRHASGRYVPGITFGHGVLDDDRKLIRLIGIVRSLDELEQAEARMREAEILGGLGHWTVDVATEELYWSEGTFAIYGYAPGSVVPTIEFAQSRYVEGEAERLNVLIREAIAANKRFEFRSRIVTAGGDERHVSVIGRVEVDAVGRPSSYSGVIQDVTDEVLREAQVRQSQKMEAIGNMTGGAAHDFNNLLAVIMGNLELVRDRLQDPALLEHCDSALTAATNGADLTRSMLAFARQAPLNPTTVDLNETVRGLDRWTRRTLPATVDTEVSLMAGLWKTDIDGASAQSALLNLILNASDAMPDGGKLTIETSNVRIDDDYIASRHEDIEPGRYVMLAVSDTGHGIADEHLDHVFEPFYTTKPTGHGTGLGLSTVQGFVKQSNGAVRVYTELGVGTTVTLYFPAVHAGPAPTTTVSAATTATTATNGTTTDSGDERVHILVAEDESDVLQLLVTTLTDAGYRVTPAMTGDAAKTIFDRDPTIDVLVTDIVMPGHLQGTDLARQLREQRPALPAIFMSGYANEATVHGNGLRPDDIRLMKPVRRTDLLHAISTALRDVDERAE